MKTLHDMPKLRDLIRDNPEGVVVVFSAPWCGYCPAMKKALEAALGELESRAPSAAVFDIGDQDPKDAGISDKPWRVKGLPTAIFFRKGDVVARALGACSKAEMLRWLEDAMTTKGAPRERAS